jgi:phosphoglycerol transferase MdoB-like AlkP superfamily enzyme
MIISKFSKIFSKINNFKSTILLILFVLLASAADYIILYGQKTSALIMLIISACIFFAAQSNFKIGKKTAFIILAVNIPILILSAKTRIYIFNILMLSYTLWYIITPYVIKFKRFYSVFFSALLILSYVIPFSDIMFPLFPITMYPFYLLGYKLKDIKVTKVRYGYFILILNIFASSFVMFLFLQKTKPYFATGDLRLVNLKSPYETSAYHPFWGIFLLWITTSICLFIKYFFKEKKDYTDGIETNEFKEIFKKLYTQEFSFLSFLFFTHFLIFIAEYAVRGDFKETSTVVFQPAIMFNLIFLLTIYLFLTSLMGRVLSTVIVSLLTAVLAIANFVKFKYFDEPFYPWDTYILKEGIMISKEYVNLTLIFTCILVFIIAVIILLITSKRVRSFFKPKIIRKLFPLAVSLVLINGLIINIPGQVIKFWIAKSWYIGKVEMLANGVFVQNYMYLKNYGKYVLGEPSGYSMEKMKEINDRLSEEFPKKSSTNPKPNIVLIMCESFWDPTVLNGVHFSEDIMKNFNKYKKGEIVSPAIGGGTSNVEFEALTGLSTYFIGPGVLAYNVYFRRDTTGIVSVLKDNGYNTIAIHPYMAEMYNRDKVYKFLDFDEFISLDGFNSATDLKGPYVSDDRLMDKVLEILSKESDNPKFIWVLTMQNHDPYVDKYDKLEVSVTSDKLNDEEKSTLSAYAEGVRDGANSLDKLITQLENSPTPTLVYFFGDHLPRMGSLEKMYEIYDRLNPENDPDKREFRYYVTPYASWSNFKETTSFDRPVSPAHIALEILKDSGVEYPSYFNILDRLKKEHGFLHQILSKDIDRENQYIKDYEMIEYDLILGNQYLKDLE